MTALLTASTINNPLVNVPIPEKKQLLDEHPENKLYHSWVDLIDKDMFSRLLDTSDIATCGVQSLFNSSFIDQVAGAMIKADVNKWQPTPTFFQMPLKVFTTLTNLEGFKYNIGIEAERKEKYDMSVHNDFACFELYDGTNTDTPTAGWMPLNFKTGDYVPTAKEAAMATGAFPLGLQSRVLNRDAKFVNAIPFLQDILRDYPQPQGNVPTLNIDGGVINNEPFEKVRELLDDASNTNPDGTPIKSDHDLKLANESFGTFENTVLMIDPFPSVADGVFDFKQDLTAVIPKTLSAMMSQMRAKPEQYNEAMKEENASLFMISPSRRIEDKNGNLIEVVFGEKAIASGALSGFSGFLSKEFRVHDYYLGRQNCEIFLRDYFVIPESALLDNAIFRAGYEGVDKSLYYAKPKPNDKVNYLPIIPIFGTKPDDNYFPMPVFANGTNWPTLTDDDIENYSKPMKKRIEKIIMNIADLNTGSQIFLWIGTQAILNKIIKNKAMEYIKKSLSDWKLLEK
jgi:hypothetical protein